MITLKTMETVENQRQTPESPHPHDDYTLIWIQSAQKGWHAIDFAHYTLQPPQIFFLKPSQVHFLSIEAPKGYVLQFSQNHLCSLGISDQYLESLGLFVNLPHTPFLSLKKSDEVLLSPLIEHLNAELQHPQQAHHEEMAASWLKLFLLTCARLKSASAQGKPLILSEDQRLYRQFLECLESEHTQHHQVKFYADALQISPDLLNQKLKPFTTKSAKELIQDQIMLSARRAAYFSQASAKQIAYQLGFDDPAHFSKFFKNCEGQSFSAFRQAIRQKYTP